MCSGLFGVWVSHATSVKTFRGAPRIRFREGSFVGRWQSAHGSYRRGTRLAGPTRRAFPGAARSG